LLTNFFTPEGECKFCLNALHPFSRINLLSIFSEKNEAGLPVELDQDLISKLLQSEGGGSGWTPVARFTINGVWNSSDNKSFAIYDTMRHKLVIMTRASYKREKTATPNERGTL